MPTEAMAKLNEDLMAALYMLGFKVAEIKGEMSIKVLRPCSSELKLNRLNTALSPGDRFYCRGCRRHRHGGA